MEYVAIERHALKLVTDSINKNIEIVNKKFSESQEHLQDLWIENAELANSLNISLRTLQSYRERGVIGYSIIGRKIYYRRSDVSALLDSGRINKK